MYVFVLFRILFIGRKSPNNRGATLCYGIAAYIFFHIAINLMGIMGMMPMTGVPLPLLSYGGSVTINTLILIFLSLRVSIEGNIAKSED